MKTLFTALFATFVLTSKSQITTSHVAERDKNVVVRPYDSTENFLGENVYQYKGQELYVNERSMPFRKYGYAGFSLDYTKGTTLNEANVYKCCDSYNSKYDSLAKKYFLVLDVIKHPKASEDEIMYGTKYFLKLQDKASKDIVYYEYDTASDIDFPFIVTGCFAKLKKTEVGKTFVVRGKNWLDTDAPITDMKSGKPASNFVPGAKWKCVDITVDERFYELSLVLQNDNGEQIPISLKNSKDTHWVINATSAEKYRKKFGDESWKKVLSGKISIGMTKEMCLLSWGEPNDIHKTVTAGAATEQWVYENNYLYFHNDLLTAMQ